MEFKEIKELIDTVNSSDISFFELNTNNVHIKMDKSLNRSINCEKKVAEESSALDVEEKIACTAEVPVKEKNIDEELIQVISPMVGTFYASSSENERAFVKEGDVVKKGDVLCIIEAMKLMNEIESEYSGVVKKILVKNGDMVEYGQPIFMIKED